MPERAHELTVPPLRSLEPWASLALETDLDQADLLLGQELARLVDPAARGALIALVAALRLAEREGSTRLPLRGPDFDRFAETLALDAPTRALASALLADPEHLAPVSGGADAFRPLLVDDGCLYAQRNRALEVRLAEGLVALARRAPETDAHAALADVLAHPPVLDGRAMALSEEQQAAVIVACTRALALITGGPGTGKTSILVSILRTLVRLGVEPEAIALAAPTGKAADRMRVATEVALQRVEGERDRALLERLPGAQTLHRLLGFSPRDESFRHHEHDPVAAKVILVDESSMVDLGLADRLVRALAPDARLVLLGDANQLPSVDAGAVFRDLCAAEGPAREVTVTLTHSYRMDASDPRGRAVLEAANAVDAGDVRAITGRSPLRADALTFAGFERCGARELDRFLEVWWGRWARPVMVGAEVPLDANRGRLEGDSERAVAERFARMERCRLLAPTRARQRGVHALNEALHGRASAERGVDPKRTLAFGEPLLVTRNDYERNLFNGDQGLVLPVRTERGVRPSAVFRTREGTVAYPLDAVRSLTELAWAVTVHKAQGSEHDVVALVLPDEPLPLTTRELVYTALTRARTSAIVLGSDPVLAAALGLRVERLTGLPRRMARP